MTFKRYLMTDTIKKNKKNTAFRLCAKRIFLTFSNVDSEMSLQYILQLFESKIQTFEYVIGKELHKDESTHFHVILVHKTKFDIRNPDFLDIQFKDKNYHGNYQPIKFFLKSVEYVCKDKQYISNITNLQDGKILDDKEFVLHRAKIVGFKQALLEYCEKYPKKATTSLISLDRYFKKVESLQESREGDLIETPFKMDNFDLQAQGKLKTWLNNPTQGALVLVGPSGIGKTVFAEAFARENKLKTLIVNHKEDFKRIDTSYDCIIIDDANFLDFNDTQKLALLDNRRKRSIKVLYQTVSKKKKVIMMVLMNYAQYRKLDPLFQQNAFARRATICEIKQPFIINVNINQINHMNNKDVINNNTFEEHVKKEKQDIEDNKKISHQLTLRDNI